MAEEKNTMPELTLTPNDTAAAAAQAAARPAELIAAGLFYALTGAAPRSVAALCEPAAPTE